jgi:hypothetical protein
VELFSRIMGELGIDYEYRVADFKDLYPSLLAGETDFFTSLQKTPERAELLLFPEKVGFSGWGQLFIANGADLDSVLDLQHKAIGVVAKDNGRFPDLYRIPSIAAGSSNCVFERSCGRSSPGGLRGVNSNLFVASEKRVKPTAVSSRPSGPTGAVGKSPSPSNRRDHAPLRWLIDDPGSYYYELKRSGWAGSGGKQCDPGLDRRRLRPVPALSTGLRLLTGVSPRLRHANRTWSGGGRAHRQLVSAEKMASLVRWPRTSPRSIRRSSPSVRLRCPAASFGRTASAEPRSSPPKRESAVPDVRRCAESGVPHLSPFPGGRHLRARTS